MLSKALGLLIQNKEQIGALAGLGAVTAPAVTLVKAGVGYLTNRSCEQLVTKNTAIVAQCIRDLREAETLTDGERREALDPYSSVLRERLECALKQLEDLQLRQASYAERNARRRFEEPEGIARWLLLYRPYGWAAWFLNSIFYLMLVMNTYFVVQAIRVLLASFSGGNVVAVGVFVCGGLILVFFSHSVALRQRQFMILGKDQHPNGDLNWIRKLLLLFIVPNWPSAIEQFLFLFCLLIVLSGLWTGFKNSIDYIGLGFFILPAWMLGYDVLLRRALAKLTPWVSKAESILVPTHADPTIV